MQTRATGRCDWLRNSTCSIVLTVSAAFALPIAVEEKLSAAGQPNATTSPVYWTWDPVTVVGSSRLVRTRAGLSATFRSSGLPAGQAVTLWFIVFNKPEFCDSNPCGLADLFKPEVQGDFLWGGGHVTGGSGRGNFGGHLRVGDASGSGMREIGMPERAVGLINPLTAEVHLALHTHGPAVPGQVLKAQMTSFTGGCEVFLGPNGFAGGPQDLPDAVGECTTFQVSVHQ